MLEPYRIKMLGSAKLDPALHKESIQPYLDNGLIKARRHPTEPLTIYNYSTLCQVKEAWDPITNSHRGLVLHDDGTVISRPYQKFFNAGQMHFNTVVGVVPSRFRVYDKLDGSLGVTYKDSAGQVHIATRGSFESDQARHATAVWRAKYNDVKIPDGQTWLFEIIFPANRIVLDYGDKDDLVIHGCIDNATGASLPLPDAWTGPRVESFVPVPVHELKASTEKNTEGFVLVEEPLPTDRPPLMVKIKLTEYQRLHKLISGLTPKRLWECLAKGDDVVAFLDGVPDEYYKSAMVIVDDLNRQFWGGIKLVKNQWNGVMAEVGDAGLQVDGKWTKDQRKTIALEINKREEWVRPLMFCILSGKPVGPLIWKQLEPSGAEEVVE